MLLSEFRLNNNKKKKKTTIDTVKKHILRPL